jgi:hypothetical protein
MGSAKSKQVPSTRRYSRASGFTHWMDNIKDRRVINIKMNKDANDPSRGTFSLVYTDDSSDDFLNIKSTFTYHGRFCLVEGEEAPFGIKIPVNTKGNVVTDEALTDLAAVKRSESLVGRRGTTAASKLVDEERMALEEEATKSLDRTSSKYDLRGTTTRFITSKLVCKLQEGGFASAWTIEPGEHTDCIEAGTDSTNVSWLWSAHGSKESHVAPPGALDFLGEEDPENGAIDLKIRIPQLAAGWSPPVVVLTEVGGWKLDKKWR